MPRVSEREYAFYGTVEREADLKFNSFLDQGYGIPDAIDMVIKEIPNVPRELIEWWLS